MIYIILLNYNNSLDTIECINSIKQNEKKIKYKIVVVDNCSQDESLDNLKKMADIKLIESQKNIGFAGGNNLGISYAMNNGADYILLLNNDTVVTKNAIYNIYKELESNKELGVISSRLMFYDNPNLINSIGGSIDMFKGTAKIDLKGKKYYNESDIKFKYTNFITGCCMLLKREVIDKVGLLEEEYFMYYEDVDYCLRIQKKGYKIGVKFDSVILHKESSSTGGQNSPFSIKWNTRNRIIFINKYNCKGIITHLYFILTRFIVSIKYILTGNFDLLKAMFQGIKDGYNYIRR